MDVVVAIELNSQRLGITQNTSTHAGISLKAVLNHGSMTFEGSGNMS